MPPPTKGTVGMIKSGFSLNSTQQQLCTTSNVIQCVDKSTNTNTISSPGMVGNGSGTNVYDNVRKQQNQKNGNFACTTQISITDVCDKLNEIELFPCQREKQPVSQQQQSSVNDTKNHQNIENVSFGVNNSQSNNQLELNQVRQQQQHTNRELNFSDLKLRCMCSSDDGGVIVKANNDNDDNDGNKTIEISDVEAIIELNESILENYRCINCGRQCCSFYRCCYCQTIGCGNNIIDSLKPNQCQTKRNHKLYSNRDCISHLSSCTSCNLNLGKYCDDFSKTSGEQEHQHELLCSNVTSDSGNAGGASNLNRPFKSYCDDDDKIIQPNACHCYWQCDKNCDFSTDNNQPHKCIAHTTNSSVLLPDSCCLRVYASTSAIATDNSHSACGHNNKSLIGCVSDSNREKLPCLDNTNLDLSITPIDDTVVISSTTTLDDNSATSIVANESGSNGNNTSEATSKRNKNSDKLVIDLNDRSKYTKEVSV